MFTNPEQLAEEQKREEREREWRQKRGEESDSESGSGSGSGSDSESSSDEEQKVTPHETLQSVKCGRMTRLFLAGTFLVPLMNLEEFTRLVPTLVCSVLHEGILILALH